MTPTKVYRVKRCNAKLRMPDEKTGADVVFTCQKQEHTVSQADPNTWHQEHIIVDYTGDSARESLVSWKDLGVVSTRRRVSKLKVVRA